MSPESRIIGELNVEASQVLKGLFLLQSEDDVEKYRDPRYTKGPHVKEKSGPLLKKSSPCCSCILWC